MYVRYGSWGRVDIDDLLVLIPDKFHEDAKYIVESYVEDAHDTGYADGEEYGSDNFDIESRGADWIKSGDFDEQVKSRAEKLGYIDASNYINKGDEMLQKLHREEHADGPWHYSFCGRCLKTIEI